MLIDDLYYLQKVQNFCKIVKVNFSLESFIKLINTAIQNKMCMSVTLQCNRKYSKTLYYHHLDQDAAYFHIHNSHHASNEQTSQTMHEAGKLFDGLLSGVIDVDDINNDRTLKLIKSQLSQKANELQNDRTSQLWIQYMQAIDILRKFIKAERTGNWELHLQAVYDMLPFFTASGHNLYTKPAYLYLQLMLDLPNNHPELYDIFMNGFHVIRRSDRYWANI